MVAEVRYKRLGNAAILLLSHVAMVTTVVLYVTYACLWCYVISCLTICRLRGDVTFLCSDPQSNRNQRRCHVKSVKLVKKFTGQKIHIPPLCSFCFRYFLLSDTLRFLPNMSHCKWEKWQISLDSHMSNFIKICSSAQTVTWRHINRHNECNRHIFADD